MKSLQIAQIVIVVLLMLSILLQSRGAGLSGVFGGSGNIYLTKRGLEKKLYVATIILSILFFTTSILVIVL